jgi:2,3-bisphosphoglycerate-independent phosphoglycerate mutase
MYAGLAREIGLDFVPVTDSGDPGTDIRARIKAALGDAVHDFIHVHTKVPDEAAHRGDPRLKQEAISALDVGLKDLVEVLEAGTDLVVAVTADHSTPSVSPLIHSGEPVPLLMAGTHLRRDRVEQFDEVSAAAGCLGLIRGRELMLMLLNYADRSMLTGHRLGKEETPYFPNQYEPFERRD